VRELRWQATTLVFGGYPPGPSRIQRAPATSRILKSNYRLATDEAVE
jgi:hypothetical protein